MLNTDFALSSWIFQRGISLVFIAAFFGMTQQVLGLFGRSGILSADHLLGILERETGIERFWQMPTVFWLHSSDQALWGASMLGLACSTFAFMGIATGPMLLVSWILYLSLVSVGQDFTNYQWDGLLLEAGFLSLFIAPWSLGIHFWHLQEPTLAARWMIFLLVFKLYFQSGIVKFTSKDQNWRNFSALSFHFWTQPLPHFGAYFAQKLPAWILRIAVGIMFIVELILPLFIFLPENFRIIAALGFALFQILLLLTGNFAFFNWLSLFLSLFLIPDSSWMSYFPSIGKDWILTQQTNIWLEPTTWMLCLFFTLINIFWILNSFNIPVQWLRPILPLIRTLYPFRICNSYGLFSVMTTKRPELVLEGSSDGIEWKRYEFFAKPDSAKKMAGPIAPYHPRLDWQMWFAALSDYDQNLWLNNLVIRIFWQSEDVLQLFKTNPFPEAPPQYIRFQRVEFWPSSWSDLWTKKEWWRIGESKAYGPVFSFKDMPRPSDLESQDESDF